MKCSFAKTASLTAIALMSLTAIHATRADQPQSAQPAPSVQPSQLAQSAQPVQPGPLYQLWDQFYNSASPATFRDFPQDPSEVPSMYCSTVIAPDTTALSLQYVSDVACDLDFSLPQGSFNGVILISKNASAKQILNSGNADSINALIAQLKGISSKETPAGLVSDNTQAGDDCVSTWKIKDGILVSRQACAVSTNHNGYVVCQSVVVQPAPQNSPAPANPLPPTTPASPSPSGPIYGVGKGQNGSNYCYYLDSNRQPFGSPVDGSNCASGNYGAALDTNTQSRHYKGYMCFNLDVNGQAFGHPLDDSACASGKYLVALGNDGTRYCYNTDSKGQAYGDPVDGSYCSP